MAALLPEWGVVREFPWLRFCYFTQSDREFVSHHYGFHVFLAPFVALSQWWTGEMFAGGRWAMAVLLGLNLALMNRFLGWGGVPFRLLWMVSLLFLPTQFFTRHAYVRAIGPSLAFMLLILLLLFKRRLAWAGLTLAVYIHVYLGGVLYGPVIVGAYVASCLLGPAEDREVPWKAVLFTAAGWALGILAHPYRDGVFEFLRLQVFGSGLSPDISVGREWNPYQNLWWFAQMTGPLLGALAAGICVRLRMGPGVNRETLCLLFLNFFFLALTFKARRFIEYWPVFGFLSAAYLLAPVLGTVAARFSSQAYSPFSVRESLRMTAPTIVICALIVLAASRVHRYYEGVAALVAYWPLWAAVAALCLLPAFLQNAFVWIPRASGGGRISGRMRSALAIILSLGLGMSLYALIGLIAFWGFGDVAWHVPKSTWPLAAGWTAVYVLVVAVVGFRSWKSWNRLFVNSETPGKTRTGGERPPISAESRGSKDAGALDRRDKTLSTNPETQHFAHQGGEYAGALRASHETISMKPEIPLPHGCGSVLRGAFRLGLLGGVRAISRAAAVVSVVWCLAGPPWKAVLASTGCKYDLPAVAAMMEYLRSHSKEGDVIFTDDWDVFPVNFYHNHKNHYVVGLDPKFTHQRRPDLWERYVRITRGQVPWDGTYRAVSEHGDAKEERIHVRLDDIREHFGARFVIVDQDHRALADRLAAAPNLAEVVYPHASYNQCLGKPYIVFQIRQADAAPNPAEPAEAPSADSEALFLDASNPLFVEQGWGDFVVNRSVSGGPIRLNGRIYDRGLGTHAPSTIRYRIPAGYRLFEATVGVDGAAAGRGSVTVSILLDGQTAFTSERILTGESGPLRISLPLGNARILELRADTTADGDRFDHVDWAEVRLVP